LTEMFPEKSGFGNPFRLITFSPTLSKKGSDAW